MGAIAVKEKLLLADTKKGGHCPPKKAAEPHALYMLQRPFGEAAIIVIHFLLVGGAHNKNGLSPGEGYGKASHLPRPTARVPPMYKKYLLHFSY